MRRYEMRSVTLTRPVEVEAVCDGCGRPEMPGAMGRLIPVVICINEGEEMGGRDELDFCNDCLVARADAFVAAGSRAEYVTGVPAEPEEDDD